MGPQMEKALLCIAGLEGQAEAYTCYPTDKSDFVSGLINRTTAARLANQGYLAPLVEGHPLRLTDRGRAWVSHQKHLDVLYGECG